MFQSFWCCRPSDGAAEAETVIAVQTITAANLRNAVDISIDDFKGRDSEIHSDTSASSVSTSVGAESDEFCGSSPRMQLSGLAARRHLRSLNIGSGESTFKNEEGGFEDSFGLFSPGRYECKTEDLRDESKDSSFKRFMSQSTDDSACSRARGGRRPTGSSSSRGSPSSHSTASPPESLAEEDESDLPTLRLSQTSFTARTAVARARAVTREELAGRDEHEPRQGARTSRSSSSSSWRIVVEKREGQFQKVGLTTATLPDDHGLEVKEIHKGGLIDEWNLEYPTMQLVPGDIIHKVNGTRGDADTLRAVIAVDTRLEITFSRNVDLSGM